MVWKHGGSGDPTPSPEWWNTLLDSIEDDAMWRHACNRVVAIFGGKEQAQVTNIWFPPSSRWAS